MALRAALDAGRYAATKETSLRTAIDQALPRYTFWFQPTLKPTGGVSTLLLYPAEPRIRQQVTSLPQSDQRGPMNTSITIAVGLIGFLSGAIIAWLFSQLRSRGTSEQLRIELAQHQIKVSELENAISRLQPEYEQLQIVATDLRIKIAEMNKDREADAEKLSWLNDAQMQMREAFEALAGKTLQTNAEEFLKRSDEKLSNVVSPLKENLSFLDKQVRELEAKREGAYKGLEEQLRQLSTTHADLQKTTVSLTQALRSPTVRGRWGELQLRRVVEMAGMVKNVLYVEQVSADNGRPDMITYLPNGGVLPLDAKVPLEAYLDAMECENDSERKIKLTSHAKAMKDRVRELSRKQYWDQFEQTPDFVVMFVPNEACLGAAFDCDPGLLDYAIDQRVLITTPVTLLALLKAVSYGWQQHQLTENSRRIAEQGKELYQRLAVLFDHLTDLQKNLNRTVDSFNKTIGSLENRLLPSARRFEEMGVAATELSAPDRIDTQVRLLSGND